MHYQLTSHLNLFHYPQQWALDWEHQLLENRSTIKVVNVYIIRFYHNNKTTYTKIKLAKLND